MKLKKALSASFLFAIIAASVLGLLYRQSIYDWSRLYNYQAPAAIAQLASDTTMNEKTRRVFYVQHPALENKSVFRQYCSIYEETIVLGCYSSNKGIFILDVEDERLQGVEQVTAAHELLHAEYDRLSSSEKQKVNALLVSAYNSLSDARIKKTIESYRAKDAAVVNNELHSILATELEQLPAELETHYRQYFNNRKKIVEYSRNYEAAFNEIKAKSDTYNKQLENLKTRIDQQRNDLELQNQALQQERNLLDNLLEQEQYEEYNAGVAPFNLKIQQYNAKAAQTEQLIRQFNELVEQQKALALEAQGLYQAIDTRVTPKLEQQ